MSISCSKELLHDKPTIMGMAKAGDPDIIEVLPENIDKGIKCSVYGAGCVGGFVVRTAMVEFTMVRFKHMEQARKKATELNGYYNRNWLFDEVSGEPVIEHFVTNYLKAIKGDDPYVKIIKGAN